MLKKSNPIHWWSVVIFTYWQIYSALAFSPFYLKEESEDLFISNHPQSKRHVTPEYIKGEETTSDYWTYNAQVRLKEQLNKREIVRPAKNAIFFVGDGMSVTTLTAARIYQGQLNGENGEDSKLSFEYFPFTGFSKTYCVDHQVPDSACTSTAYLGGVKANMGTVGVTAAVKRKTCTNVDENQVQSIGHWSQESGKATGFVTTTRVTHASPAGFYAHTCERNWESDLDMQKSGYNETDCTDIATQLIYGETGSNFNVILGGGRNKMIPKDQVDEEKGKGERLDGVNLIEDWKKIMKVKGRKAEYIWNKEQLLNVQPDTDYLMGLFENDHMQYHMDANPDTEPTLSEMVETAIQTLSKNSNGFFLFVEGGKIDLAHHETQAHKALDETLEFAEAVRLARKLTDIEDTLIVVTADHAHTMSMNGYPDRGNDIFGIAGRSSIDNLPYSTLSYANGPNSDKGSRHDLSQDKMDDKDYKFPSMVPLESESHGGDDVAIFASGPWAHLYTGVIEQNVIPHIAAYALCVGKGITVCDNSTS